MSVISVSHLSKFYSLHKKEPGLVGSLKSLFNRKYEIVQAVNDVSFKIDEGELVGFIGPNGAGKTTTLKCLSGLLYPDNGKVEVLGATPYARKPQFLKQIAFVMGQKNQLWWDLPPLESFILNKEIYGIPEDKFRKTLEDLTNLLDVKNLLNIQVRKLSLGQRMKFELVAALLHSPRVLFLDEPTIGLDIIMQKNLREFIREYNYRYQATIILTSHYMGDVEALCKRVIVINNGKIIFDGLLANLVKKFAPYKIITVLFKDFVDPKKLESFGEIKKFHYPELILRVSKEESNEAAALLLKNFPIEDVNIEDPQIEDVIREVFSKKGFSK